MRRYLSHIAFSTIVASIVGIVWASVPVEAVGSCPADPTRYWGRLENEAYYTGERVGGTYVWNGSARYRSGMTSSFAPGEAGWDIAFNANIFIDSFRVHLDDNSAPLVSGKTYSAHQANAAALILQMLGIDGNSSRLDGPTADRRQNGITLANTLYGEWVSIIREYDRRGLVNWNDVDVIADCELNGNGAYANFQVMPDVTMQHLPPEDPGVGIPWKTVTFYDPDNPSQEIWTIKKACANLHGQVKPLTRPSDFELVAAIAPGANIPASRSVDIGTTYTVRPGVQNIGNSNSNNSTLTVTSSEMSKVTIVAQGPSGQNPDAGSCGTLCWRYSTIDGPSSPILAAFQFRPNNGATGQVCFTATVTPRTGAGGSHSVTMCLNIAQPKYPYLTAENGNVHAGGSCIPGDTKPGAMVRGNPGSYSQYIVSSANVIDNFSSRSGSGGLNWPGYGTVCLPDLNAIAEDYEPSMNFGGSGYGVAESAAGTDAGFAHQMVHKSGNFTLGNAGGTTTIRRRWTLHVRGNLYIDGNVQLADSAGGVNAKDAPSFGVIVDGNIFIGNQVTRLDGFYFAKAAGGGNGLIKTCARGFNGRGLGQPGGFTEAECRNRLIVNGFLYAQQFRFDRTGT